MKNILCTKAFFAFVFCLLLVIFSIYYYFNNRVLINEVFCGEWRGDIQKTLDCSVYYQTTKDEEIRKRIAVICTYLHYIIHKNGMLEYEDREDKPVKQRWNVLKSTNKMLIIELKDKRFPEAPKIYFEDQGNDYIIVYSGKSQGGITVENKEKGKSYPPTKLYLKRVVKP